MKKKKILLVEGIHPGAKTRLENQGFYVELENVGLSSEELMKRAGGFHAIGVRSKTQITKNIIDFVPDLETIGCFCIGTDQVDLDFANKKGIPVFNAPYSNTRSVAELVVCEMIALSRRLADRSAQMHKGVWTKSASGSNEVRGKTLGIVGYGHIGSQLSVLAESMGVQVIYYDIVKKLPLGNARSCDTLGECLQRADFISLHVPDTPLTNKMIGANELGLMKNGAYLINASRGTVVDIPSLAEALRKKHIAGAAVDVFPIEPASNKERFISEIQELENVVLTPHIGGSTEEAQEAIGLEVAESFIKYFYTGATTGAVNFPQLDVHTPKDFPRILNIHANVPGVLGAVNSIISDLKGNIVAQHLSTDRHVGYLIMDVGIQNVIEAEKKIAALKTSIRTRVLTP
jgi:D-3-phosphoglycerate dehydrogenase / 2-oxoglutarate reductase